MNPILEFPTSARAAGLRAFTTTRAYNLGLNTDAPAPQVISARRELWSAAGLPLECSVFMRQVHGDRLEEVGASSRGRGSSSQDDAIPDCDAMVAQVKGTFLCVGHADCLAVLLADPTRGWVGAAHCGWRGAQLGTAAKTAGRMISQGSHPEDLWVGLSVCLGPCHLELSQEQHRLFSAHPGFERWCSPLVDGHFKLDLWACVCAQLEGLGISAGQIETQRLCTACHLDQFFSYRAEAGKTGRMMSVIGFQA